MSSNPKTNLNNSMGWTFKQRLEWLKTYITLGPKDITWVIFFLFLKSVPFYFYPVLIKVIIDQAIPIGDTQAIGVVILIGLGLGLMNIIFHTAFSALLRAYLIRATVFHIQRAMVIKLQRLPQVHLDRMERGKMFAKIVVNANTIGRFLGMAVDTVFAQIFSITTALVVLLMIKPILTLMILVVLPIFLFFNHLFRQKFRESQKEARLASEDLSQAITVFIQTNFLSRLHGEEDFESKKVNKENTKVFNVARGVIGQGAIFGSAVTASNQSLMVMIAVLAAFFVVQGKIFIGEMVLFIQFTSTIVNQIGNMINQYPVIVEFNEAVDSMYEVLGIPDEENWDEKKDPGVLTGAIKFDNVSFTYPGLEQKVLSDITVEIKPGNTIALVGESGSGKSTFIKLVQGLYLPTTGELTIDDKNITTLNLQKMRRQFGVVSQETVLFTDTVMENITHGRNVDDPHDLMEALRKAHAYDFVMELPNKLDERVVEAGRNFSGGQRQRLAIARALFRKPRILILDEATSALDSESEKIVQDAINELLGSQTTLVIAHRLSTIFGADHILVFKEGRIIESGTHRELLNLDGEYKRLISIQFKNSLVDA